MMKKGIILFSVFTVFISIFFAFTAKAQLRSTDLVLTLSPAFPSPNQNVTATLASYVTSLDKAKISWSINGQESNSGIGKKSFSFTTLSAGSSMNLVANIETVDGENVQKSILINPGDIDMLWEAVDAYVPPFYKGKKLAPTQGYFKVVAIPNLTTSTGKVDPNNLSYTWTRDGNGQPNSSGWGKNAFTFKNSYLDTVNEVEVEISSISGNSNAYSKINLQTVKPKILFYQKDPVFGVKWEKALNNGFKINPEGETLIVEPYFFSPKNLSSSDLSFKWFINNQQIETPNPKNILSVKLESTQSGSAKINIAIENIRTLFQSMEKELSVEF